MSKPRVRFDHGANRWRDADIAKLLRGDLPADLDPTASDEPDRRFGMPRSLQDAEARGSRRRVPAEQPRAEGTLMNAGSVSTRYTGSQAKADRWGFDNFASFLRTVRTAQASDDYAARGRAANTLRNAALSTYGSEGVGADGGFAVPPEFRDEIATKVEGDQSILPLTDQVPISSNSITVPKDETAPWGSAGIQAYWTEEAATMTQRKPSLERTTIRLHKLTALVPLTDELIEDAPALSGYVSARTAEVLTQKLNESFINGSGVGQPLGILNSSHLITQAAEASQVADTIHGLNLIKMWSRMPARWRSTAVWHVHPDAEPQLLAAGLQIANAAGTVTTGGRLVYQAADGVSGLPYATLFGRPVIPLQSNSALGDVGDIIFASWGQYGTFVREGGLRADSSIHVWFDQGVTAFRFQIRIAGAPWWSTPLPDKNGSGTRSAFVTLAAR